MNLLTVSLQFDNGTAELTVAVNATCCSGSGSAWFELDTLSQFAIALEAFPLDASRPPSISGGHWNHDATELLREHVHISVKPLDKLGSLALRVKTFVPASNPTYGERDMGIGLYGDFLIDYERLTQLAQGIRNLVSGKENSIQLEITPTIEYI